MNLKEYFYNSLNEGQDFEELKNKIKSKFKIKEIGYSSSGIQILKTTEYAEKEIKKDIPKIKSYIEELGYKINKVDDKKLHGYGTGSGVSFNIK